MTKDVSMQAMTMKEYVSVALLSDIATDETIMQAVAKKQITPEEVVDSTFDWAEIWMEVRNKRKEENK